MTEIRYSPGDWRAAVTPQGVAILPSTMEADMLGRIWRSLQAGHGLGAVLESLTGAFGTSLRAIPPFAVVTFAAGEVRLAVRGPIDIDVVEPDASYSVSGADVTTWSERVVRNPASLVVRTDTPAAEGSYGMADGIVLCAELTVTFARASAPSAPPTSAPAPPTSARIAPPASGHDGRQDREHDAKTAHSPEVAGVVAPELAGVVEPEGAGVVAPGVAASAPEKVAAAAPEETIVPPEHTSATPTSATPTSAAPPTTTAVPARSQNSFENVSHGTESDISTGAGADEALEFTQAELPDDAYDHLWGATVVKSVEHAAVRELDDVDEPEEPARATATPAESTPSAAVPASPGSDGIAPAAEFAPSPAPPTSDSQHWTAPPLTGLIDSVPGFGGVGAASSSPSWSDGSGPSAPTSSAAPTASAARTAADTPSSNPGPAASGAPTGADTPPATGSAAPLASAAAASSTAGPTSSVALTPAGAPPDAGTIETGTSGAAAAGDDHDGLTVTVSELEAMRRLAAADSATDTGAPATPDEAVGRLILSTGESHPLDRPVIIGRRPRANRVQADQVPLLVTVASPEQDISRNHLEVRIEGRHVLAADLDTTNGSVLHREGTPPLRLAPNEPVLLLSGDVIDLGDGITVLFEDLP